MKDKNVKMVNVKHVHAIKLQIVRVHVHIHSFSNPTLNGGQWSTSRPGWGWVGPKFYIILVNVINFRRRT
jgi:hypothetical protein